MKTLYDISAELSALEELMLEADGDVSDEQIEATIDKWFAEIADAEAEKIDAYCSLIRNWDVLARARKDEASRLNNERKILESSQARLKNRLLAYMTLHGKAKIQTARFQVYPQGNGGEAPMWVDPIYLESPELLPERFHKIEANTKALREALEAGADLRDEHGNVIAQLMPRGQHLRIK